MKIVQSQMQLSSQRVWQQQHSVSERLRMWNGARPEADENIASSRDGISTAGRAALAADSRAALLAAGQVATPENATAEATMEAARAADVGAAYEEEGLDARTALLKNLVEALTGVRIEIRPLRLNASEPAEGTAAPAAQPEFGVEYDRHEIFEESEVTSFAARGEIVTSDGRRIAFSVDMQMARHFRQESTESLRLGNAVQRKDPLVINFNGTAAQLDGMRVAFDLDADGSKEQFSFLGAGSGFLALDRNGDGIVNDGRELFGALSGDGFGDLAALDDDGNGWIDESDAAWLQLRVWVKDADGSDRLLDLGQAGVGALFLGSVATDFALTTAANEELGQIRRSGVWLSEDGRAGTLQKIDITV